MYKKAVTVVIVILMLLVSFYLNNFRRQSVLDLSKINNPTLVFVGDSMTANLGNFDELRNYLKEYFPNTNFNLLNYGFGATNILSVQDRLDKDINYLGRSFQAINKIPFDVIFIESFGNNPLSHYPLNEGLKMQTQALNKIVKTIKISHPEAKIVFIATIAPSKDRYAEGAVNLTTEKRREWADERIAYIKNHIRFAKMRNIPLINIYEKSLDENGSGNIDYISSDDFIHPSPTGIYFISEQIAEFLVNKF